MQLRAHTSTINDNSTGIRLSFWVIDGRIFEVIEFQKGKETESSLSFFAFKE